MNIRIFGPLMMCLLIIPVIFTAGCTDTINGNGVNQSTESNLEDIFEIIEYNVTSEMGISWLKNNHEVVIVNPDLFMRSISNEKIKLNIMGEVVELELEKVPIPEGSSMMSLDNGVNLEISDSNDSIFQGQVVGAVNSSLWLWVSQEMGFIVGEINTKNKVYHIWNTGKKYNGKNIEIIYLSKYQSGELKLTVLPEKTELELGESTNVELTLKNIGNTTLNIWRLEEQISYDLSFVPVNEDSHADYECGVATRPALTNAFLVELKPGESLNIIVNSGCWALSPGEYMLSAVYRAGSGEMISKPYWIGEVKSNEVLIKILDVRPTSENAEEIQSAKAVISISGLLEYLNFTQLSERSELIVTGTVEEVLPAKWNTPDGRRRGDTIYDIAENDTMYTDIIIKVDQYLKGSLDDQDIRVRTLGGEDDIVAIVFEDEPFFKENERVLLYLRNNTYPAFTDIGPEHYVITGVMLGKFTLTDDGMAVRPYEYVNQTELLDSIEKGYEPVVKTEEDM